jgi:hypothetical protein
VLLQRSDLDINYTGSRNLSPLMVACIEGNAQVCIASTQQADTLAPETLKGQMISLKFWFRFFWYKVSVQIRVSPYRFKFFFAYKRNKANLDPFHLCFTISL